MRMCVRACVCMYDNFKCAYFHVHVCVRVCARACIHTMCTYVRVYVSLLAHVLAFDIQRFLLSLVNFSKEYNEIIKIAI